MQIGDSIRITKVSNGFYIEVDQNIADEAIPIAYIQEIVYEDDSLDEMMESLRVIVDDSDEEEPEPALA